MISYLHIDVNVEDDDVELLTMTNNENECYGVRSMRQRRERAWAGGH
jgi:hypothetical protein